MITGLVHVVQPGEAALAALADTLSALVGGVAAGLVGDAVVIVPAPDPEIAAIAEATGAALVVAPGGTDPWRAGAAAARRDWVLCLAAGDVPAEGWIRALDRFVGTERDGAVVGRLRRPRGPIARLAAAARGLARPGRGPRAGDLVRRAQLLGPAPSRPRVRRLAASLERVTDPS
jgi:hypothetical protein